ncbi:hypothetical protein GIW41_06870 [Pseudomonas sp. PA-6-1D]|uniref:restriction endonuclease subunit S n=1 Tax=Pseudomonas TaxID=286 RepID=UPI001EEF8C4B|nr:MULTISPECIES: restriction endonuclease subunit S [Pseudomonas]MCF5142148.1 hypothetical protein [Pseudomonas sp. PA-6-3C]MCF5146818.1 hypothetical protein [Pseudomonas sp. PA-6-3F]MCF5159584.1 hypothetical protein [Pseudomonas sp. PA-6-2E]MCF5174966.1 hypothetical protein [Pseudomonas sp. PA-6-1D]MCF5191986.1 hypothetical protein [Pseudomonas sp. PA-6-1H]
MSAQVKPGYKLTEAGAIPSDWNAGTLKNYCTRLNVGFVGTCEPFYTNETKGVMLIRTGNLKNESFSFEDMKFVTKSFHDLNKKSQVRIGDILIARHGDSGSAVLVPESIDHANTLNIVIIRPDNAVLDNKFSAYAINSHGVKKQVIESSAGSTQSVINTKEIAKLIIPIPPLPEQRAIANALASIDALISGLDQLIIKKQDIKQATMQQLLTGQLRLPGFSGEWKVKRLGDIATLNRIHIIPSDFPSHIFSHFSLPAFDETKHPVIESGSAIGSNKFRVPEGSVLVSKLNPRIPRVWMPLVISESAIASTEFLVLTAKEGVSREYLFVACSSPFFCDQMILSATGTTGSHQRISPAIALDLKIATPTDVIEQSAIATVLSDMDNELTTLKSRRLKAQDLKQSMVQALLTGRIRLSQSSQEAKLC